MGRRDTDMMEEAMASRERVARAMDTQAPAPVRDNLERNIELAKIDAMLAVAREVQELRDRVTCLT